MIAKWESKGKAHSLSLFREETGYGMAYSYKATGGGGYMGLLPSDAVAIFKAESMARYFQPDANKTKMIRTF